MRGELVMMDFLVLVSFIPLLYYNKLVLCGQTPSSRADHRGDFSNMPSRCTHKGCGKEFEESENVEGACVYHSGAPVCGLDAAWWLQHSQRVSYRYSMKV